jgi:hypothetical protein
VEFSPSPSYCWPQGALCSKCVLELPYPLLQDFPVDRVSFVGRRRKDTKKRIWGWCLRRVGVSVGFMLVADVRLIGISTRLLVVVVGRWLRDRQPCMVSSVCATFLLEFRSRRGWCTALVFDGS